MALKNEWRDKIVYIRQMWGERAGQPDFDRTYKVRSCGKKEAILDRYDPVKMELMGHRGHTFRTAPPEEVENYRQSTGWRYFRFSEWKDFFIPAGEPGWDMEFNIER